MKQAIKVTKRMMVFYVFVFLFGLVYQPNWVVINFWINADFYEDIPFQVPYLVFLVIYSFLTTIFAWYLVKFVKKHL